MSAADWTNLAKKGRDFFGFHPDPPTVIAEASLTQTLSTQAWLVSLCRG